MVPKFLLVVLVGLVGCDLPDEAERRAKADRENPPPELGTIERLAHEVKWKLGESNRGVAKVSQVAETAGRITIDFAIDDNLGQGMIQHGAKMDLVNILKAVEESGIAYEEVHCRGSFSLVDKLGNASEERVLNATYSRKTIERINWENFLTENVYEIAERVTLHPELRE